MGWFLIAVSAVLFAVVDTLVGFVLSPLAAAGGQQFPPAKVLFDALLAGTATFGTGAVVAVRPHVSGAGEIPRVLAVPALLTGLAALASGVAGLLGLSVNPHVIGVGIGGGSALFALIGLSIANGRTLR